MLLMHIRQQADIISFNENLTGALANLMSFSTAVFSISRVIKCGVGRCQNTSAFPNNSRFELNRYLYVIKIHNAVCISETTPSASVFS